MLERKQFGKPLAENQHVQFKLADMATDLVTARYVFGVFDEGERRGLPSPPPATPPSHLNPFTPTQADGPAGGGAAGR